MSGRCRRSRTAPERRRATSRSCSRTRSTMSATPLLCRGKHPRQAQDAAEMIDSIQLLDRLPAPNGLDPDAALVGRARFKPRLALEIGTPSKTDAAFAQAARAPGRCSQQTASSATLETRAALAVMEAGLGRFVLPPVRRACTRAAHPGRGCRCQAGHLRVVTRIWRRFLAENLVTLIRDGVGSGKAPRRRHMDRDRPDHFRPSARARNQVEAEMALDTDGRSSPARHLVAISAHISQFGPYIPFALDVDGRRRY